MKKIYKTPTVETFELAPEAYMDVLEVSNTVKDEGDAKDRAYEEDNEAFNVTDGEGMASYGDLW